MRVVPVDYFIHGCPPNQGRGHQPGQMPADRQEIRALPRPGLRGMQAGREHLRLRDAARPASARSPGAAATPSASTAGTQLLGLPRAGGRAQPQRRKRAAGQIRPDRRRHARASSGSSTEHWRLQNHDNKNVNFTGPSRCPHRRPRQYNRQCQGRQDRRGQVGSPRVTALLRVHAARPAAIPTSISSPRASAASAPWRTPPPPSRPPRRPSASS